MRESDLRMKGFCFMFHRNEESLPPGVKRAVGPEVFVFLSLFSLFFVLVGREMGTANMLNTMMNTAYALLMDTCLYIMAIAVLAGAISAMFSEFGVISLFNRLLSGIVEKVYGLPGASAIGVFTTYLSDNPAILTLANDNTFRRYFKKYQLPALTNIGTSFGMGLIVTTYMVAIKSPTGESFGLAVLIGNLAAVFGSIISTRLMLRKTAKLYGRDEMCEVEGETDVVDIHAYRRVRVGNVGTRLIDAILIGGKSGVDMGLAIIPGVLIICTLVMMLTNTAPAEGYTGAAYEGVGFLPWLGEKLHFLLMPIFGFSNPDGIAIPITALGAAGAAIGMADTLVATSRANAHDIAVFTAMCMCWSGYLSTHVAMMDSLKCRQLTGYAILYHTIGGLCAGAFANWIYTLVSMLM